MRNVVTLACCAALLLVALAMPRRALAQPPSLLALEPWNDTLLAHTWDEPLSENKTHVRNDGSSFHLFWYDSYGRFRLSRGSQSPSFNYRLLDIDLGSHTPLLPKQLTDQRLTMGLHLGQLGGWDVGLIAGVGYDGNSPFDQTDAVYGVGHLELSRALDANDSLAFTIDYSGFHSFLPDVPLPGFAFEHHAGNLQYMVGYPSDLIRWRITSRLSVRAKYTVPFSGDAVASYHITRGLSLYARYRNYFEGFHVRNYPSTQRLFFNMDRAEVGIRFIHTNLIDLMIGVGYAFNQEFSRGFDVRSLRSQAQIANAPYVAFLLRGSF